MHDATPQAMLHAMHYVLQGGELDAEADDDILKSSKARTEIRLSADQLYHYELAQPRAEHVRSPAHRSHPPPTPLHACWRAGSGLLARARRTAAAPLSRRLS